VDPLRFEDLEIILEDKVAIHDLNRDGARYVQPMKSRDSYEA
jgi:hypothetical protein